MTIHYGMIIPPQVGVAVGDVFVSQMNGNQQRAISLGPPVQWVPMQPGETRGDILPRGGNEDQVLVRGNGFNPFASTWAEPGPGLIWEQEFVDSDTWTCGHNLRSRFVSVLTVNTDGVLMIPDIDYENATDNVIILRFSEDVSGTVVIRR